MYSNNQLPTGFKNFFITRSEIHNYQTRNKQNFQQTRYARSFSDKSIRTQGPQIWNSFDNKIKKSFSSKHFRNQYKNYLLSGYEKT